jgi:hypothetical protein
LSANPNAIHLLEQNPEKINWYLLSSNPNAIHLLEQNQDKINWWNLSANPKAIHLLERNQEKIYLPLFSNNQSICEPDYLAMSIDRTCIIYQELMEKALHPLRVMKWIEEDFDF